jgi:hypothetical protein
MHLDHTGRRELEVIENLPVPELQRFKLRTRA